MSSVIRTWILQFQKEKKKINNSESCKGKKKTGLTIAFVKILYIRFKLLRHLKGNTV